MFKRKTILIVILATCIVIGGIIMLFKYTNIIGNYIPKISITKVEVSKITAISDEDNDGIVDSEDILLGARKDAENKPKYNSAYYLGGYPPDNEGVCTDVVWRALKEAGFNLKDMIDEDIKKNVKDYPRVEGKPDRNIDFRRVPNLQVYFSKYLQSLTTNLIPGDVDNLVQWQGGDIVVFGNPNQHVAIISDKRNNDGVPYIIHNAGPYTKEVDALLHWSQEISPIVGHYRIWK